MNLRPPGPEPEFEIFSGFLGIRKVEAAWNQRLANKSLSALILENEAAPRTATSSPTIKLIKIRHLPCESRICPNCFLQLLEAVAPKQISRRIRSNRHRRVQPPLLREDLPRVLSFEYEPE